MGRGVMRISIFAARSWGRIGNLAAAHMIEQLLKAEGVESVQVTALEDIWPLFADWGERMRAAAALHTVCAIQQAFADVLADVDAVADAAPFSAGAAAWAEGVDALAAHIRNEAPDHVVATKGLIARMAHAVRTRSRPLFGLTNWVTNPGLLALACHRAPEADKHVVPLAQDQARLVLPWGVPAESGGGAGPLMRVSPLVGSRGAEPGPRGEPSVRPRVLFSLHYLSMAIVEQIERLIVEHDVECVVLNSAGHPSAVAALAALQERLPSRFTSQKELSQAGFHGLFRWLNAAPSRLFVAKSGPNTMFEAVALHIPFLLYRSGLPQEDWVIDYIAQNGLGMVLNDVTSLCERVSAALLDLEGQERMLARQTRHQTDLRDQTELDRGAISNALFPEPLPRSVAATT